MGVALYRKYRSVKFDDVIGQDHIITTVKNMIKSGNIPHAFLLTGPRGVGKTSVARLIACSVNKIDYKDLDSQVDIIEIDGASNRKIDEIREIREQVNIVPTSLKYKVYIVDEVHMLTREAFNALLKTLEEPPEHVIFILATTEFHKLPPTIISRCIRFHFKPISKEDITKHLTTIAQKEKINIDGSAIETIASHSDGSFRDGITLLENFRSFATKVSQDDVEHNLGIAKASIVQSIIDAINASDSKQVYSLIDSMQYNGVNYVSLANDLSSKFRNSLIENTNIIAKDKVIELMDGLLEVQSSTQPKQKLVIVLLGATVAKDTPKPKQNTPKKSETPTEIPPEIDESPAKEQPSEDKEQKSDKNDSIEEIWDATLKILKTEQNTIYAISRMGKIANFQDNSLTIEFKFPFHAKRMNDSKNKILVEKYLSNTANGQINVSFIVAGGPAEDKNIQNISNIFGHPEVLE
ncbi:DNA polymerase III, subunit gamma and tau [Candidatus Saccharibacteria bacterium RIFCSPHIGHO2_12_FULL_41_12]|nr:MAG: DNA polymerase III, subunit gamma and tau [Candidatus Saccharibacteria bacterium RIFCSPHIGHO2_12_FULL_41_12]